MHLEPTNCECASWCDMHPDVRLLTGHHENCPKCGNPFDAAKDLIRELVRAMESWGCEEDGIFPGAWEAYKRGKAVIWEFDWKEYARFPE